MSRPWVIPDDFAPSGCIRGMRVLKSADGRPVPVIMTITVNFRLS